MEIFSARYLRFIEKHHANIESFDWIKGRNMQAIQDVRMYFMANDLWKTQDHELFEVLVRW